MIKNTILNIIVGKKKYIVQKIGLKKWINFIKNKRTKSNNKDKFFYNNSAQRELKFYSEKKLEKILNFKKMIMII